MTLEGRIREAMDVAATAARGADKFVEAPDGLGLLAAFGEGTELGKLHKEICESKTLHRLSDMTLQLVAAVGHATTEGTAAMQGLIVILLTAGKAIGKDEAINELAFKTCDGLEKMVA